MERRIGCHVVFLRETKVNENRNVLVRQKNISGSIIIKLYERAALVDLRWEVYLMSLCTTPRLCRKSTPESKNWNHSRAFDSSTSTGTKVGR